MAHPFNDNLRYDRAGLDMTKASEGLRLTAYQDSVGVWTIGYGHTKDVQEGDTCTPEQADEFLQRDISEAERYVHDLVNVPITQGQYNALVDFTFNLGSGNLAKSSLLRYLNQRQYGLADAEFDKWNKAGGKVLAGLTKRRDLEQAMFDDQGPEVA